MHGATRPRITELNPHLLCVLCGGYYVDATAIIECLHAFCKSCIVHYLETHKYCPICDVLVHKTKPLQNIRPDNMLQNIVYKLVPQLYAKEMQYRQTFYSAVQPHLRPLNSEARGDILANSTFFTEDETINISVEYIDHSDSKLPAVDIPEKRFMRCEGAVTVANLQKLISYKYCSSSSHDVIFFYNGTQLPEYLTLKDVAYISSWKRNHAIPLMYQILKPHRRIITFGNETQQGSESEIAEDKSVVDKDNLVYGNTSMDINETRSVDVVNESKIMLEVMEPNNNSIDIKECEKVFNDTTVDNINSLSILSQLVSTTAEVASNIISASSIVTSNCSLTSLSNTTSPSFSNCHNNVLPSSMIVNSKNTKVQNQFNTGSNFMSKHNNIIPVNSNRKISPIANNILKKQPPDPEKLKTLVESKNTDTPMDIVTHDVTLPTKMEVNNIPSLNITIENHFSHGKKKDQSDNGPPSPAKIPKLANENATLTQAKDVPLVSIPKTNAHQVSVPKTDILQAIVPKTAHILQAIVPKVDAPQVSSPKTDVQTKPVAVVTSTIRNFPYIIPENKNTTIATNHTFSIVENTSGISNSINKQKMIPKSLGPPNVVVCKKTNINNDVPQVQNDMKSAKFFKMRNTPRFLGNPSSGIKAMYQVVSDDKNGSLREIKESSNKNNGSKKPPPNVPLKIDPKTLCPIVSSTTTTFTSALSLSQSSRKAPPPLYPTTATSKNLYNHIYPASVTNKSSPQLSLFPSFNHNPSINPLLSSINPLLYGIYPPTFPATDCPLTSPTSLDFIKAMSNLCPPAAFHPSLPPSVNMLFNPHHSFHKQTQPPSFDKPQLKPPLPSEKPSLSIPSNNRANDTAVKTTNSIITTSTTTTAAVSVTTSTIDNKHKIANKNPTNVTSKEAVNIANSGSTSNEIKQPPTLVVQKTPSDSFKLVNLLSSKSRNNSNDNSDNRNNNKNNNNNTSDNDKEKKINDSNGDTKEAASNYRNNSNVINEVVTSKSNDNDIKHDTDDGKVIGNNSSSTKNKGYENNNNCETLIRINNDINIGDKSSKKCIDASSVTQIEVESNDKKYKTNNDNNKTDESINKDQNYEKIIKNDDNNNSKNKKESSNVTKIIKEESKE